MAKEEKTNLYLLSIVGIVAVVGIVVMIISAMEKPLKTSGVLFGEDDLTGQPVRGVYDWGTNEPSAKDIENLEKDVDKKTEEKKEETEEKKEEKDAEGGTGSSMKGDDCPKRAVC
jgi:hypothetical protein